MLSVTTVLSNQVAHILTVFTTAHRPVPIKHRLVLRYSLFIYKSRTQLNDVITTTHPKSSDGGVLLT